jgi:hypothetical protein
MYQIMTKLKSASKSMRKTLDVFLDNNELCRSEKTPVFRSIQNESDNRRKKNFLLKYFLSFSRSQSYFISDKGQRERGERERGTEGGKEIDRKKTARNIHRERERGGGECE